MIYTSYFAKLNKLPKNITPISICGKAPSWYGVIVNSGFGGSLLTYSALNSGGWQVTGLWSLCILRGPQIPFMVGLTGLN